MIPMFLLDIAQPLPSVKTTVFAFRGLLLVGSVLAAIGLVAVAVLLIVFARKKKK